MSAPRYPPGPRHLPLLGGLRAARRDPLGFFQSLAGTYGDIAYTRLGAEHVYLLNHPDYVKDVLVTHQRNFTKGRGLQFAKILLGEGLLTSEGPFHQRQRRLAQPAFHRQRIAGYGAVMVAHARRAEARWRDGATVDSAGEMMRLTLGIVGKTLFDADVEAEAQEIGVAMAVLQNDFQRFSLPFAQLLERLPLPSTRRAQQARARLDATVYRFIGERRASGTGQRGPAFDAGAGSG